MFIIYDLFKNIPSFEKTEYLFSAIRLIKYIENLRYLS